MTHRYLAAVLIVAATFGVSNVHAQQADTLRGRAQQIAAPKIQSLQEDRARQATGPSAPSGANVGQSGIAPSRTVPAPQNAQSSRPGKSGSVTPNLSISYTPSGWDGPLVASSVVSTTTQGTLTAGQPTYLDVNWDNEGSDVTISFLTGLFLDGSQVATWSNSGGLQAGFYSSVLDFELPVSVTAGTHTLQICTDLKNDVAESDETDHCYEQDFTWQVGQPNLSVGYTPDGWDYPIVPSHTTGTTTVGTLIAGQPAYVDVAIGIASTEITSPFTGELYFDGSPVYTVNWTSGLPGGQYGFKMDIELTGIAAGTHALRFCVDPANALAESDETDNCYERDFTWQASSAQPNLVADYTPPGWDFPIVPSNSPGRNTVGALTAGQTLYVDYAYINRDADVNSTFHNALYLDGSEVATSHISGLAQDYYGYKEDRELALSITAGDHTLMLCVDVNGVVGESDESDNCYSRTFTWEASATLPNLIADYTPSDWDLPIVPSQTTGTTTLGTLVAGNITYVDVAFVNRFADIVTRFTGTLYVDGTAVASPYWDSLQENFYGHSQDIQLPQAPTPGSHTLRFCIDVDAVIAEADETDNCYEQSFTWTEANQLTAPTPLSPGSASSPGPEVSETLPTFTWTTVSEATQYEFNLRNLTTGGLAVSGSTTQSTSLTLTSGQELVAGHAYRWDVTSQRGSEEATSIDLYFRATSGAPLITVSPSSIALSMEQGETTSRSLSLGNSGSADLTWSVSAASSGTPAARLSSEERRLHAVSRKIHPQLQEAAKHSRGLVPVIVRLAVPFAPENRMDDAVVRKQRAEVAEAQAEVFTVLSRLKFDAVKRFATTPFLALRIEAGGLEQLAASPSVAEIIPDAIERPFLAESTQLSGADVAWSVGATGSGQVIAVLDTGVDASHPFLAGKVVHEACFSTNYAVEQRVSACPNGAESQLGTGSGAACSVPGDCSHGTHVAGIAAGSGSSFSGVAPGADIIAIQVFHVVNDSGSCVGGAAPCVRTYTSDLMQALEHVYELRSSFNVASVNLSLGGGLYESSCDDDPRKPVIDNLRAAGIATIAASGNDDQFNTIGAPACISSAISVGATTKSDGVAEYSNSASILSLLAPGSSIRSSVVGGGYEYYWGTSMATPHVAGAWAVFLSANPSYSVSSVLQTLISTGTTVTDGRNGIQKPRIDIGAAVGGSASWVTLSPPTGTTPPGSSSVVSIDIDTSGLDPGTHEAVITVASNSSTTPMVQVPVAVSVIAGLQLRTIQVEAPGCSGETIQLSPTDQNGLSGGSTPFSRTFEAGTSLALSAPASCSSGSTVFSGWLVAGNQVSTDLSFTTAASTDQTISAVYETAACPVCGDASGNGSVSGFDASLILQHSAGLEPASFYGCAADVSGNGSVTAFDASVVLRYNVGLAELTCTGKGTVPSSRPGVLTLAEGSRLTLGKTTAPVYSFELHFPNPASVPDLAERANLPGDWQLLTHFTSGGLRVTAAGLTPLLEGTLLELGFAPGPFGEARLNEGEWVQLDSGVPDLPDAIVLSQNYPNPFNPNTEIAFEVPREGRVRLSVFDMVGREVRVLAEGHRDAGRYKIRLEAFDLPSGMYLYRLAAGGAEITRMMVLLK